MAKKAGIIPEAERFLACKKEAPDGLSSAGAFSYSTNIGFRKHIPIVTEGLGTLLLFPILVEFPPI